MLTDRTATFSYSDINVGRVFLLLFISLSNRTCIIWVVVLINNKLFLLPPPPPPLAPKSPMFES